MKQKNGKVDFEKYTYWEKIDLEAKTYQVNKHER